MSAESVRKKALTLLGKQDEYVSPVRTVTPSLPKNESQAFLTHVEDSVSENVVPGRLSTNEKRSAEKGESEIP